MLLAHPTALWLLLLAIPLIVLHARGGRPVPAGRWGAVTALRLLAFVLLVLALARPLLDRPDDRRTVVAVLDASASVSNSAFTRAIEAARSVRDNRPPEEDFALVIFDHQARIARPGLLDAPDPIRPITSTEPGSALADGLQLAGGLIPRDGRGRVVVYSDGLETSGDAGAEAWKLARRGIPVEVVACEVAADREVALVSAVLPPRADAGATALLEATIDATEPGPAELVIESRQDGTEIRAALELTAGRQTITRPCPLAREGLANYTVRVVAEGDGSADNNELPTAIFVEHPVRVAVVEDAAGAPATGALSAWLRASAVVQTVTPSALADPHALDDIDVLALADVPVEALSAQAQQHIVEAVTDGLGLLVSGGYRSFGPGGYARTPLADVLPVRFSQEVQRRDPSTTLVIIIDTSGSMGGPRVNQAKEIARLAIARLKPHDKVGIVEFYGSKRWAAPIQPASNAIDLQRALNRLSSGGGTIILPAIEEAYYALQNVQTRTRHVLVLTDGGVEPGAFEPLIRKMSDSGITLSTVLVGPGGHSAFLASLAQWGRGRFYAAPDRFNMPEIIVKQPESSLLSPFIEQPVGLAVRSRHPIVNDLRFANAPLLAGYVETQARPTADVLIASSLEHPVLTMWHYGLGTVAACATHIGGQWSRDLSDWPDYQTMMCGLVRALARPAPERALRIHPIHRPGAIELSMEDGRPSAADSRAAVELTLTDAAGQSQTRVFDPIGPNRWNALLTGLAPGTYTVSARTTDGARGGTAALVVPPVREVTSVKADTDRLASLAGWSDQARQRAAELGRKEATRAIELQPILCLVVVLLIVLNVLLRRWPERTAGGVGVLVAVLLCAVLPSGSAAQEATEPAILEAQSRLNTGEIAEAREVLRAAVQARPESATLWAHLGRAEELLGNDGEALSSLSRAESLETDPIGRLALRVRAAQILYDQGEPDSAAELLRLAAADAPEMAAMCAHVAGLSGDSGTALELLPDQGDNRARFHAFVFRGQFLLRLNRPAEAEEEFARAFVLAPLARDRRYALERRLAAARAADRLSELADEWLRQADLPVEQLEALLPLLLELDRADESLRLLQRNDWSDQQRELLESPDFQRSIVAMAVQAGQTQKAVAAYHALMDRQPRQVEWRVGLGRLLLLDGQAEQAEQLFLDAVARSDQSPDLMALADGARRLGLDDAALAAARKAGASGAAADVRAVLFEVDLTRERGQTDAAMSRLRELARDVHADPAALLPVAEAFERYGDTQEALRLFRRVYEGVRSEDVLLRIAWLLEQNNRFDEALALWKELWETTQVPARRRQAQERVLDLASRGGQLADLAIELEERLAGASGDAPPNEQALSLLIDIYTTANDPVSAAEILQEYSPHGNATGDSVEVLKRLARVYLSCEQFGRCNRVLRRLVELDPANAEEYLQQIAVVALERRQPHEARAALEELETHAEDPALADEFAAGVLDMLRLHDEAAAAYARLLDRYPDRIEAHLMWGNAMKSAGRADQAVARFQALVEEAAEDDLFTVAVDGLLNLQAPPAAMRVAYRRVVSRIAARPDQVFLYQLAADLQDAMNRSADRDRVLEQSVVVAGERRAAVLRELMDSAAADNQTDRMIQFGRSILALDQQMPPQVYLDLGEALIKSDRPAEAERVFARARVGADFSAIQQKVATYFENANRAADADRIIRELLVAQPDNVPLLIRSGGLCEQLGRYDRAFEQYGRAADLMLRRLPRAVRRDEAQPTPDREDPFGRRRWRAANLDEISQYFASAGGGLLNAARSPELRERLLADLTAHLDEELNALEADGAFASTLETNLRLSRLAAFVRHVAFCLHEPERADAMDRTLLARYHDDARLAEEIVRTRVDWGLYERAMALQEIVGERAEPPSLLVVQAVCAGRQSLDSLLHDGTLAPTLAAQLVPALIMSGRTDDARRALRAAGPPSAAQADELCAVFVAASVTLEEPQVLQHWLSLWLDALARRQNGRSLARSLEQCIQTVWNHLSPADRDVLLERFEGLAGGFSGKDRLLLDLLRMRMAEALGRPFADRDRLIAEASRDPAVGIDVLTRLLDEAPPEERPGLLRGMAAARNPRQTRGFLMDVAGNLRAPADDAFVETFMHLFRAAPPERMDPDRVLGAIQRGAWNRNAAQPLLIRQIGEMLLAEMPTSPPVLITVAAARSAAGAYDEARLLLDEAVESLVSLGDVESTQSRLWDDLASVLTREDSAALAEELDERVQIEGKSVSLMYGLGTLQLKAGRWDESVAAFEQAFRLAPSNRPLGRMVIRMFQESGRVHDLTELLSALLTRSSIMESFEWRTLTELYCNLFDPLNAQRAVRRVEGPLSPVEVIRVDRMMDRRDLVRAAFLRFLITNRNEGRFFNPIWPNEPSAGGMAEYLATQSRDPRARPTLFTGIADLPFAEEDCAALLRAAPPDRLDVPGLVNGLSRAVGIAGSQESWLAVLTDACERDALTSKDRRLIVALAGQGASVPTSLVESLNSLPVFTDLGNFRQAELLNSLVILYAASGRQAAAQNLLAWLVAGTPTTRLEDRFQYLEDYLRLMPPDQRDAQRRRWADFLAFTPLDHPGNTYAQALLGFVEQIELADERRQRLYAIGAALEAEVSGRESQTAPWMELARCRAGLGQYDGFVEAVSQGVARARSERRADWITAPLDCRRFLPIASCMDEPARYVRVIVDALLSSTDADRLPFASDTRGLCLLGHWCVENNLPGEARAILERLNVQNDPRGDLVLWCADLARQAGQEDQAIRLETALLKSDRLPVLRVPHVLDAVETREGKAAADALAIRVAAYSDHPVVLRRSADAAQAQGDPSAAQAFLKRLQAVTPSNDS